MNAAQKVFVEEMIKHGDENRAVVAAYPQLDGDTKKIRTYCGRLLKNVEIAHAVQQRAQEIESIATSEAVLALKNEIVANTLSAIEKRNILAQIARGEIRIQEHYFNSEASAMEAYYREPNSNERAKAIEIDNKMSGDFAPSKKEITVLEKGVSGFILED